MSWLDKLSDAGGELLNAVTDASGNWLNGAVEQSLDKKPQSNPDEARKTEVQGQTADGQPLQTPNALIQPSMDNIKVFGALFIAFMLVVFLIVQGKR
ncbi:hypothetical protein BOO91_16915 [Vibrio navarrensis]|uniref:hypothetical protein n=1 Tax=Vibrio TaxID=662 RepID=UPI0005EF95CE|nr:MULTISPECIES: hypothetical protein [Vibrio]KJR21422.1 hypothetical protein UF06_21525 [Vibrio sp. S234-5]MBE3662621.1 hypothetical protein [Vibrio navarrensis]MBE4602574.1 hypothetical protein [Vibrio navarrensis]MBE4607431.1 hypothetical protein [Vibrio navarrensis]MBE4612283.1 hypothetical protein [Vibrio navarrensis]